MSHWQAFHLDRAREALSMADAAQDPLSRSGYAQLAGAHLAMVAAQPLRVVPIEPSDPAGASPQEDATAATARVGSVLTEPLWRELAENAENAAGLLHAIGSHFGTVPSERIDELTGTPPHPYFELAAAIRRTLETGEPLQSGPPLIRLPVTRHGRDHGLLVDGMAAHRNPDRETMVLQIHLRPALS